ncbi:hypothetical protein F2Q69_00034507 [Brassica cretica]|uniref:Uncharacterized protein n=1 Tax=Brassica cretica TaxID=69181 RepID=A0A8S9SC83_BRACR|nr:hypothetical protein F2Q69_00034507 [Brassica cretica]
MLSNSESGDVNDLLLELEGIPPVLGSGEVGNKTRVVTVTGGPSNTEAQSQDWALVDGGLTLSLSPIRESNVDEKVEIRKKMGWKSPHRGLVYWRLRAHRKMIIPWRMTLRRVK